MSTIPLSATTARLKPPRDKPPALVLVSYTFGNPVGNRLLTRAVLVVVFIQLFAKATFVGAESTSTPRQSTLSPNEAGDSATHTPEGLPKVASTAFFLIALFLFSIGISYFFRYYVFSRDRKECCCEKQSQSAVSPESMGLKNNTSRQTTPENGNVAKTGLYANIFARSYDSDEEEIRQLELEAQKADEESDSEFRSGKKPAKPSRQSILKALETASRLPKLSIHPMNLADSLNNGTTVRDAASIWMDKALNKPDENKNVPGMTVVDVDKGSNMASNNNSDNHCGLTSVIVHRNPSPTPSSSPSLHINNVVMNGNISVERHDNESMSETPRTNTSNGMLSIRPKSGRGDMDGYSTDFESISLHSELSNITELQKSMGSRSSRANTAKRKYGTYVSPTNDISDNHYTLNKETTGDHSGNHNVQNATNNADNMQADLQGSYKDAESKHFNTEEPQSQDDPTSGQWANKVARTETSASGDTQSHKRTKDSNQSDANPSLAIKPRHQLPTADDPNPQEVSAGKANSEDDKPGTPESGTPLLTDKIDTDMKLQDSVSDEPADHGDAPQSLTGNQPVNIYAKYANNAKLPNKHIQGETKGNDRQSTSAIPKTPVKDNREARQKSLRTGLDKDKTSKTRKSSAVSNKSKPSDSTSRPKTSPGRPNPQKKKNAKR